MSTIRDNETDLPPEAVKRIRREKQSSVFGYGLMIFGAAIIALPVVFTRDLPVVPGLFGLAIVICGGIVNDPRTWSEIADKAIGALPFAKK